MKHPPRYDAVYCHGLEYLDWIAMPDGRTPPRLLRKGPRKTRYDDGWGYCWPFASVARTPHSQLSAMCDAGRMRDVAIQAGRVLRAWNIEPYDGPVLPSDLEDEV